MDVRQYWADVQAKVLDIASSYPEGVVHIISRHNREKNTTAGAVSTASLQLAAECLVNNTHDLASPEQITNYKRDQVEKRRQITVHERSKKQEFVMVVDRNEAESRGIPMPQESEPAARAENKQPTSQASTSAPVQSDSDPSAKKPQPVTNKA